MILQPLLSSSLKESLHSVPDILPVRDKGIPSWAAAGGGSCSCTGAPTKLGTEEDRDCWKYEDDFLAYLGEDPSGQTQVDCTPLPHAFWLELVTLLLTRFWTEMLWQNLSSFSFYCLCLHWRWGRARARAKRQQRARTIFMTAEFGSSEDETTLSKLFSLLVFYIGEMLLKREFWMWMNDSGFWTDSSVVLSVDVYRHPEFPVEGDISF